MFFLSAVRQAWHEHMRGVYRTMVMLLLVVAAVLALVGVDGRMACAADGRVPNIVLILADDKY